MTTDNGRTAQVHHIGRTRTHAPSRLALLAGLALSAALGSARADTVLHTYSGNLGDSADTRLAASDGGPAQFGDELAIANNVVLVTLAVEVAGHVNFSSLGYADGGLDPYFTLFNEAGGFVASNGDQAFSSGGDFSLDLDLAIGNYTWALGAFANLSFAENLGEGQLADGFTGLGTPSSLGDGSWRLAITQPAAATPAVPEPGQGALMLAGLLAAGSAARTRRRSATPAS